MKLPQRLREYLPVLLTAILLFAARSSLADHYVVPSGSMEPTLVPGDRVLVDKRAYGLRVPFTRLEIARGDRVGRGEVVIFDAPDDGTRLIKRVVAVGGDVVAVRGGRVFVNGVSLAAGPPELEAYGDRAVRLDLGLGGGPDLAPTRVPAGRLLMLGDARGNSRDGRWFGLVREDDVYARALGVYWRAGEGLVWRAL